MPNLLNEKITAQIREIFAGLQNPVHLMFFERHEGCDYCGETKQLMDEIAALSDKLSLSVHDLDADVESARRYQVDKAPGIVIAAKDGETITDLGIRYAGIPSGHEFSSFIQDIISASARDSGLSAQTRAFLHSLTKPIHLQVFVTPTWPHCPRAVVLAHMMAMENPQMITAEAVEATEFPELANKHRVHGVPHTSINHGREHVVGAVPEVNLLAAIQRVSSLN